MTAPPFTGFKVLSPARWPASRSVAAGFVAQPTTFCRLTLYFEPLERELFFGIDQAEFLLTGKLYAIGGERLKAQTIEAAQLGPLSSDACVAIKIGLLSLQCHAKDYFGDKADNILMPTHASCPLLHQAVPSLREDKNWLTKSALDFDGTQGDWVLGKALPQFAGFNVDRFVQTYFEGTLRALAALESGGHWRDLFVLLQCAIDHLAWLARPANQDNVTCSDFCRWVYRYLRLHGDGSLETGEVYHWRCQWVHTYGGQSPAAYAGLALANQYPKDYERRYEVTVVGIKNLLQRYQQSLAAFATHCSLDPRLREVVNERLEQMPQVVPI